MYSRSDFSFSDTKITVEIFSHLFYYFPWDNLQKTRIQCLKKLLSEVRWSNFVLSRIHHFLSCQSHEATSNQIGQLPLIRRTTLCRKTNLFCLNSALWHPPDWPPTFVVFVVFVQMLSRVSSTEEIGEVWTFSHWLLVLSSLSVDVSTCILFLPHKKYVELLGKSWYIWCIIFRTTFSKSNSVFP